MFADESKLYRIMEILRDVEILPEDLNFVSNWSKNFVYLSSTL